MVGANSLEVLLIEAASEGSAVFTGSAVLFKGAGIAGSSICSILLLPFRVVVLFERQCGSMWACISVLFRVILELPPSIERGTLVKIG